MLWKKQYLHREHNEAENLQKSVTTNERFKNIAIIVLMMQTEDDNKEKLERKNGGAGCHLYMAIMKRTRISRRYGGNGAAFKGEEIKENKLRDEPRIKGGDGGLDEGGGGGGGVFLTD